MSRERVVRMWQIVEALRSRRRGLTVPELVDLVRTSRSTVYRDLAVLEEAGVPLTRERIGGEARHRLATMTSGVVLASHEIAALALARQMLDPLDGLQIVEALDRLLRRLGGAGAAPRAIGVAGVSAGDHRATVRAIDMAIRDGHRLQFDYASAAGEVEQRLVDPVAIRLHRGQPYLVAHDVDRADWRIFKASRIEGKLELAGEADPHDDYDEQALFGHSVGVWSGEPVDIAVRLTPDVASRAAEYPLTDDQIIEPQADGAVIVRARVAGIVEAMRWILGWGPAAEALEPVELREAVRGELRAAAAAYGENDDPLSRVSHTGETGSKETNADG